MNNTTRLLKKLMEFRPVSSDVARVNACADYLRRYLDDRSVYTRVEKHRGRKIIYAGARTKSPALLFNAHLDVVPADDDTFRVREKSGWIWGRGAGDCLGNCAVLARSLVESRDLSNAGVIFSTDEEVGGDTIVHMIRKGYRGKLIIVMDTTSRGHEIAVAHKGLLTIKLTATGKACHGSAPWRGRNAIDRLIQGYAKVKPLFSAVTPGDEWQNTCSANLISGGTVFNRVPDRAELVLDIRHTGTKTQALALARKIRSVSGLRAEILALHRAVQCDESHPAVRELRQFMAKHLKRRIGIIRMNGATDARHFDVLNAPIVMFGVPYRNPHASDERVHIKGMLQYQNLLADLIEQGLPACGQKR